MADCSKKETPAGGCRGFSETMIPEGVTLQGRSYAAAVSLSSGTSPFPDGLGKAR